MTTVKRSALVPYSAEQMFALVNEVEAYPEFLPWCTGVTIVARDADALQATIAIEKGPFKQQITTRNIVHVGRRIDMKLVEGPFKYLTGTWQFHPLGGQGCDVSLHMHFEITRGFTGLAFGQIFNQIANSLVDAFCRRAAERFGRP